MYFFSAFGFGSSFEFRSPSVSRGGLFEYAEAAGGRMNGSEEGTRNGESEEAVVAVAGAT